VTQKDQFPPSFSLQPGIPVGQPPVAVGWVPPLLSFMEQNPLYQVYQASQVPGVSGWTTIKDATVSVLICPSGARGIATPAPLSYAVNCGLPDTPVTMARTHVPVLPLDYQENGVFFDAFSPKAMSTNVPATTTDLTFISRHDGTSTTLLFTENLEAMDWMELPTSHNPPMSDYLPPQPVSTHLGQTWWQGVLWDIPNTAAQVPNSLLPLIHQPTGQPDAGTFTASMTVYEPIGSLPYPPSRPSSKHPGGFLVTMCDGHTQFMRDDVDFRVYCMLMAPDNTNAKYTIGYAPHGVGLPIFYPGRFNTSLTTPATASTIPLIPLTENDLK
jgi:hypothetical protein